MDWWSYRAQGDVLAMLALSISGAFVFGGAAGLLGWRMMRASGWTGAVTFLAGFVGVGLLRDHTLQGEYDPVRVRRGTDAAGDGGRRAISPSL